MEQYIPIISIIGRKNVGKSTLFNQLIKNRKKIQINKIKTTIDRKYGEMTYKNNKCIIIDTGGFNNRPNSTIEKKIQKQSLKSIEESNIILLVIDGSTSLTDIDKNISHLLRKTYKKNIIIIVNKIEKINLKNIKNNFHCLGTNEINFVSALYGKKIINVKNKIFSFLKKNEILKKNVNNNEILCKKNLILLKKQELTKKTKNQQLFPIKLAFIGKPNVGKSTLINCILKKQQVITHNTPGTTQENIYIPVVFNKKKYTLIDTMGITKLQNNKKKKIKKYIINETLNAVQNSNVVLLLIDVSIGMFKKDINLINFVIKKKYKILIILVNKCDLLNKIEKTKIKKKLTDYFKYEKFIEIHFISAKYSIGISSLFKIINNIYKYTKIKVNNSLLTRIMKNAIKKQQPLTHNKKIKLKFVNIKQYNPLTIVIHGNNTKYIHNSYKNYLKNIFYENLKIKSIPIQIKFK
ncbi:MAG: 50S ribosomal subunit stability factor [Candidatus Westeberhardia cardiocondylae]|nr:50S ribosomal subunit stability factor [Candidatus Westeberhardia cardiocondylae]